MTTAADAPSDSCEALPAVMEKPSLPSFARTGLSLLRSASWVPGRLPSSLVRVTCCEPTSPVALSLVSIVEGSGTISSSKAPASCAAAVRRCDSRAYSSCASREKPYLATQASANTPIALPRS